MMELKRRKGDYEIVGCADLYLQSAASLAEKFMIPASYDNYIKMLDVHKPDAVICLVGEKGMANVASDVLSMGYRVLLEKPPGKSPEETIKIAEASEKSNAFHMVAFNRRHMPVLKEAKNLANGKISHINYSLYRRKRYDPNFEDTAIHAVDTVRWLSGDSYKCVDIFYQELPELGKNVANYFLYCEFENQSTATIQILVDTEVPCESAEIHLDSRSARRAVLVQAPFVNELSGCGSIEVAENGKSALRIDGRTLCQSVRPFELGGFYAEHELFYDCVKNNIRPADDARTAIQTVAICEHLKNRSRQYKNLLL
jgi:predicted dehydrogenase